MDLTRLIASKNGTLTHSKSDNGLQSYWNKTGWIPEVVLEGWPHLIEEQYKMMMLMTMTAAAAMMTFGFT